ncbi:magnesium transporter [Anaeromyxobacter oryzae]|uniref:Magnesium transporter MgtE n=1 Tax=Anaeromyxobacter oryzae TaxID=2918170 RepID=A0ABM7WX43_9BACT|nr:magnesium transporter [Anaeromyxobacter oryzae]BDG04079.1 magnesium transporter MgtE [Anaeromyxobacter oryzae]
MAETEPREALTLEDLADVWHVLSPEDRVAGFRLLPRSEAEEFFLSHDARDQAALLRALPPEEQRSWARLLAPDDAADLVQALPPEAREHVLGLLDDQTRREVRALLAYAEDDAGGLMSPRYARLRPDMSVDEAITYLRRQARERLETIYYVYVLDESQRLLGVVSFRDLFAAPPGKVVRDVMHADTVAVRDDMDQEAVGRVFRETGYLALPVLDAEGHLKGIVTLDDIVDVVEEEATEDIQKLGGMEALGAPYLQIGFRRMVGKRAGWLAALFLGEMLTATAMARFEDEIARAVVLALFVPLIISSGGNSGSQATTLVIRAMALGEVRLRDWWRVARREIGAGLALGTTLGSIGFLRIVIWQAVRPVYGPHYLLVASTVFCSLVGVVTFGTLAGSLLPFLLRALKLDPASASAPFVATLVDVTGLVIYFTTASAIMTGTLL